MAYLQNKKFLEIREAAKNGNEKALQILQAMRKGSSQEDVDRLTNDYYAIPNETIDIVESTPIQEEQATPQETIQIEETQVPVDLTEVLDGELDGIISENEVEDISFGDFLKNKKSDFTKAKKNADYFKAFDQGGREKYLTDKTEGYTKKFGGRLQNIDRHYNDTSKALGMYSTGVNDLLDDEVELDTDAASKAYEDFTGNETAMNSFGRHWDENDNQVVLESLKQLVSQYGKKNVQAAINLLMGDNENYKAHRTNQIETEIGRYQKDLEKLLK